MPFGHGTEWRYGWHQGYLSKKRWEEPTNSKSSARESWEREKEQVRPSGGIDITKMKSSYFWINTWMGWKWWHEDSHPFEVASSYKPHITDSNVYVLMSSYPLHSRIYSKIRLTHFFAMSLAPNRMPVERTHISTYSLSVLFQYSPLEYDGKLIETTENRFSVVIFPICNQPFIKTRNYLADAVGVSIQNGSFLAKTRNFAPNILLFPMTLSDNPPNQWPTQNENENVSK